MPTLHLLVHKHRQIKSKQKCRFNHFKDYGLSPIYPFNNNQKIDCRQS
jgi:hypothetical protein